MSLPPHQWPNQIAVKENWKKITLKSNITTKCIDHKDKNTETTCKSIQIPGLHCFNSSAKCWKMVSLKPSLGLSLWNMKSILQVSLF